MAMALLDISTVFAGNAASNPIDTSAQEQLLRDERERMLRQQEAAPAVRMQDPSATPLAETFPEHETPCFVIDKVQLTGDAAARFQFALPEATAGKNNPLGRCLGSEGINLVMARMQNAIIERGYVTTRVLAPPQDLNSGVLILTVIPGRVRQIRFADGSSTRAGKWNAIPIAPGDILNLRDIEQGLENLKRVPTAEADIQIVPTQAEDAQPGESDIVISYQQRLPFRLTFTLDDAGFDSTGKHQGGVTFSADSLLTLNDLFYVNYNHDLGGGDRGKRGSDGYAMHYSIPWHYWLFGATTSRYEYFQEVAGINQSYIYSGRSHSSEIRVSRLLYRNAINKTTASVAGLFRKSDNFIDDTEIEVQRRRTAGWEISLNQLWFLRKAILDYTVTYRRGTGARNALKAPEDELGEGTSRFEILAADLNFNLPFTASAPWGEQYLRYAMVIRAQKNFTPLTPQDRFSIGNRYTVRGFDGQFTLLADRGWFMRNDLSAALGSSGQSVYVGLDYGEVGGQSSNLLLGKELAGAVLGMRGAYRGLSYDVFLGKPLHKPKGFKTASTTAGFNLIWSF